MEKPSQRLMYCVILFEQHSSDDKIMELGNHVVFEEVGQVGRWLYRVRMRDIFVWMERFCMLIVVLVTRIYTYKMP